MEFIGRLYDGFQKDVLKVNPSTLSGATDVIVVQQPDGSLKSSPFYVRFGKLKILHPRDQVIELYINDTLSSTKMYLEQDGTAYFIDDSNESENFTDESLSEIDKQERVRKTLSPSNEVLQSFHLHPGANRLEYRLTHRAKSVCGALFVLPTHAHVVVTDVDGTITRSAVCGQVVTAAGGDWTREGIAKLYSEIEKNGYFFLYLTARTMGMIAKTKRYLFGVMQNDNQNEEIIIDINFDKTSENDFENESDISTSGRKSTNDYEMSHLYGVSTLPRSAVLTSPDRLGRAVEREVIAKTPDVFKTECLRSILSLFPEGYNPFYAGFGDKETDSKTYLSLGIPPERVFTVGKKGKRNVVYDETEMSVEREKKKNKRRFIRIKRKLEEDAEGNSDDEEKHENEMTFEMLYERVNEFFPPCEPWNSS